MDLTLDELRAGFEADPSDPRAYRALVAALSTGTEPRELAELHERWAETCGDPLVAARALAQAGEQREAFGDGERAERQYLRALELDPRQDLATRAFLRLAGEHHNVHRHVEQLTHWATRLVEVGASPSERAEVELALARAHAAIPGRLDRCFEHHRAAVELDPELEATLGEAVERARQARRIADVRSLLSLAAETTRSPERRLALLRALAQAQQEVPADLDAALASLAAASALVPEDTALLQERIALLAQRARRKKGSDAEGADQDAAATLEVALARLVDPTEALAALERALAMRPGHREALGVLEALVTQQPSDANRACLGKHLLARVQAAEDADTAEARLALAAWYQREERHAEAYEALAPLLVGTAPGPWLSRAYTLALAAGRWTDAAHAAQRLHAGEAHAVHERVALEEVLKCAVVDAELDAVQTVAERLLELVPHHGAALRALADVYAARGEHASLRGLLERRLAQATEPQQRRELLRALVDLADGPLSDPELGADAFQKLAELDPRDRALRGELLERLASVGRYRAIADVRRWEIASLESLPERKAALDALLALSEEHPFDGPLLVAALRAYREADPTDVDARAALVRQLHGAGQLDEAAELLREAVRATDDTPTRLAALAELADICDIGLRDDEAARDTALQILELDPENLDAVDRLERAALRSKRRDWLVEALGHRALVAPDEERADVYLRLGRLQDEPEGDPEAAMIAYAWVRTLRPDVEASVALLRLFEAHGRHAQLAELLDDLASETTELETRVDLLKRRARVLRDELDDAEEAARCYREVRTLREDDEALTSLLEYARATDAHQELAALLATRLTQATTPEEVTELGMERATLLLDHLGEPREAERELRAVLARDPRFAPALARLGSLYLEEGDDAQLAEVTEAHLALMSQPQQRAALAQRLFGIYERSMPSADKALAAARHWVEAAPSDLDALRALSERLDPTADAAELVRALEARADELLRRVQAGEADDADALRDEALMALEDAMMVAVEQLEDAPHAETRLLLALELAHDERADVDRFVHLATMLDAQLEGDRLRRAAATFLARKATAVPRPHKERLFLASAELFGDGLEDARLAFEVLRRAIVECSDDATVLRALVDVGTDGGFADELNELLAERFAASLDAKAARALQRERANLLYTLERYGEAADAYHRLTSMEPDNERAKVRYRECLVRAERYQDLLITLGQALRRLDPDDVAMRAALLRDVARTWESGLHDTTEAIDAWKAVLAVVPADSEASAAIERLAEGRSARRSVEGPPSGTMLLASSESDAAAPRASLPPPPPPRDPSLPPLVSLADELEPDP